MRGLCLRIFAVWNKLEFIDDRIKAFAAPRFYFHNNLTRGYLYYVAQIANKILLGLAAWIMRPTGSAWGKLKIALASVPWFWASAWYGAAFSRNAIAYSVGANP